MRFLPIKIHTLFAIGAFLILVLLQMDRFADDPGVGWHLKTGEYIWQNFEIPRHDPFLYSKETRPWIADQWLSDLLLYGCFSVGSWPFTYAVLIVVCLASYFTILSSALRKTSGLFIAATIVALMAFRAGNLHFIWRPVVFGVFFFAVVYGMVIRLHKKAEDGVLDIKSLKVFLFGVPLGFCLWANMHPSFILGLFLVFALASALFIDRFFLRRHLHLGLSDIGKIFLLFPLGFIGSVLNPWGIRLHESILFLSGSSYFMELHDEWKPIQFGTFEGNLLVFIVALIVISFWFRKKHKINSLEVIVFGSFLLGTLDAVRMFPYFGIAASFSILEALRSFKEPILFRRYASFERIYRSMAFLEDREAKRTYIGKSLLTLLLVFIPLYTWIAGKVPLYHGSYGPSSNYPYEAIRVLREEPNAGNNIRVLAVSDWGGFITLTGFPKIVALIDDRNTLLGEDFYKEFLKHMKEGSDWYRYFGTLEATHVLLPSWVPIVKELKESSFLRLLHQDQNFVLFRITP